MTAKKKATAARYHTKTHATAATSILVHVHRKKTLECTHTFTRAMHAQSAQLMGILELKGCFILGTVLGQSPFFGDRRGNRLQISNTTQGV